MMNMSIECDVVKCQFNQQSEHYCTLNCIHVKENNTGQVNASDCGSFKPREE